MKNIPFDSTKIEIKRVGDKYLVEVYLRYSEKNKSGGVISKSRTIHKEYVRLGNALNGLALMIDRIPISVDNHKELVAFRRPERC